MQNNYSNRDLVCSDIAYAGFWVRLAAYFLDNVIVFFMLLVVRLAMSGFLSVMRGTVLGGNILFHYTLKDIVLYLGQVLYFILCTRYTGTTIGKKAMNLRVVNADGSPELDFLTVAYRETVGRFLCSLPMCIGYLVAGLDKEKRGIHDMLCDTRVVYAKKVKPYPMYRPPVPPGPGTVPPMGAGMRVQPGAEPMQPGQSPFPPMGTGMTGRPGSGEMPPMGAGIPGQPGRSGIPSVPPMPQDGPYRMIRPKEQNLHPEGEALFGGKQEKPDQEEKPYAGIEEKEDSNRS